MYDPYTSTHTIITVTVKKCDQPVLEIDSRGYHGRRTKDIWEDQKTGRLKNSIGECQNICSQL